MINSRLFGPSLSMWLSSIPSLFLDQAHSAGDLLDESLFQELLSRQTPRLLSEVSFPIHVVIIFQIPHFSPNVAAYPSFV